MLEPHVNDKESRMKRAAKFVAIGLGILGCGVALAYQEVIFEGVTYGCENTCVIRTYGNGSWMITDSKGGRFFVVNPR